MAHTHDAGFIPGTGQRFYIYKKNYFFLNMSLSYEILEKKMEDLIWTFYL